MTPLPAPWGADPPTVWRLDQARFAATWESGEGAFCFGGRWNSREVRAVYTSLEPATAILEVAVHKGFRVLDTLAHILTSAQIVAPERVRLVHPDDVPNPNWLRPGPPSAGQQAFGDRILSEHGLAIFPSAVSMHSWNLVFVQARAQGAYRLLAQEPFALDPRLHPPAP